MLLTTLYQGEWRRGKLHGAGVQFLTNGLVYEGEFEEGMRHGRGRQRRSPAVAEVIEDGHRAARAMEHVRRGVGLAHEGGVCGGGDGGAAPHAMSGSVVGRQLWRPVASAFAAPGGAQAKAASLQPGTLSAALDAALTATEAGVPDTRTALFALLGMGHLVHEGWWVEDAAVGGRTPLDASFYRELRQCIGLAKWECGRLSDETTAAGEMAPRQS